MTSAENKADEQRSPAVMLSDEMPREDDGRSHLISLHIELVKKQDREAMTLIWERYIAYLLRFVSSQCKKNPRLRGAGADDLTAETFESFWKAATSGKLSGIVDREGLLKMLCKIAKRKVAHHARDESRLKRGSGRVLLHADADPGDSSASGDFFEQFESDDPLPEDLAIATETLASAYAALPDPKLREVLELWLQQEYTQPEIAKALGCSVTTVGRRVAEIRACLGALSEGTNSDET
jgi:RNA polymerase sigma factor (sigma-70 family)